MELLLTSNHVLKGDGYFLGLVGENISDSLIITVQDENLHDKWAYIEFKNNDDKPFSTERLTVVEGKINYPIVSGLLKEGSVIVQVVFRNEIGVVWKSFERKFMVGEALCVSDTLPVENPDFITEAQKLLDSCETTKNNIEATSKDLTKRVEDCETVCDEIKESEATRIEAETTRQTNESARQASETTRVNNESARISSENTRITGEEVRSSNEAIRNKAEEIRKENERLRVEAENSRIKYLQSELTIRDKLLENMELANEGKTYNNVIDNSTAYQKTNPENVLPYAKVNTVGGMSYKSKNLLILEDTPETTVNGVGYSIKGGVITLNGTATDTVLITILLPQLNSLAGTYTLSAFNENTINTGTHNAIRFYNLNTEVVGSVGLGTINNFITFEANGIKSFNIRLGSGETFTNFIIKPMLVKGDTAPTEFKQGYEGFRHSPVNQIRSVGKNLFNVKKIELLTNSNDENISITKVDENSITITTTEEYTGNGYISTTKTLRELAPCLVAGKTYFLSAKTQSVQNIFYLPNFNDNSLSKTLNFNSTFVLSEDELNYPIFIYGFSAFHGDGTGDCVISNIQIEEGTVATEYEPYKEYTLTIPEEVQSLEGYGLGVDATYRNYLDLKNRKYVQMVGIVDLGTLNWRTGVTYGVYSSDLIDVIKKPSANTVLANIKCDKYVATARGSLAATDGNNISVDKDGNISVEDSSLLELTSGEVQEALTGIYLIYELATPIETDISINDYLIKVEEGGSITFENEYKQAVPSNITYQVKLA